MRLERDAVGSVTRERPRRKDGEPHRRMFGGTALGGRLRVDADRAGRGVVSPSVTETIIRSLLMHVHVK